MKTSINTKIICDLLNNLSYYALARNMSLTSLVQQKREHISCYVKAFMLYLLKAVWGLTHTRLDSLPFINRVKVFMVKGHDSALPAAGQPNEAATRFPS